MHIGVHWLHTFRVFFWGGIGDWGQWEQLENLERVSSPPVSEHRMHL